MDIKEYIEKRVDNQINWYDKKSQDSQKRYKQLQIAEIILASLIPLLSGHMASCKYMAVIVGLFGAVIAVIESISKLNQYHENWIQYRSTCEMLRYQKHLYLTESAPYNRQDETIENIFIRTIETIISSENNQWKNINTAHKEANGGKTTS